MIEILDPFLTAGSVTSAALAGWLAGRRRHLLQMRQVLDSHQKQNAAALGHLGEARLHVSLLKKEIADLQARWLRFRAPRPLVEPSVLRAVVERAPRRQQSGDESGFPDTQPWEAARF